MEEGSNEMESTKGQEEKRWDNGIEALLNEATRSALVSLPEIEIGLTKEVLDEDSLDKETDISLMDSVEEFEYFEEEEEEIEYECNDLLRFSDSLMSELVMSLVVSPLGDNLFSCRMEEGGETLTMAPNAVVEEERRSAVPMDVISYDLQRLLELLCDEVFRDCLNVNGLMDLRFGVVHSDDEENIDTPFEEDVAEYVDLEYEGPTDDIWRLLVEESMSCLAVFPVFGIEPTFPVEFNEKTNGQASGEMIATRDVSSSLGLEEVDDLPLEGSAVIDEVVLGNLSLNQAIEFGMNKSFSVESRSEEPEAKRVERTEPIKAAMDHLPEGGYAVLADEVIRSHLDVIPRLEFGFNRPLDSANTSNDGAHDSDFATQSSVKDSDLRSSARQETVLQAYYGEEEEEEEEFVLEYDDTALLRFHYGLMNELVNGFVACKLPDDVTV
jgi:hypothetical protein